MAVKAITKENYEAEIIKSDKAALLDFWAPWCVPCRQVGKTVEELDRETDIVKFAKINIEDCPEIAASLGVMSIPVLILFNGGKPVERLAGVQSKKAILKKISKHCS